MTNSINFSSNQPFSLAIHSEFAKTTFIGKFKEVREVILNKFHNATPLQKKVTIAALAIFSLSVICVSFRYIWKISRRPKPSQSPPQTSNLNSTKAPGLNERKPVHSASSLSVKPAENVIQPQLEVNPSKISVSPIKLELDVDKGSPSKILVDKHSKTESSIERQSSRGAVLKDVDSIEPEKKIQEQCPAKSVEDSPLNAESDSNLQSSRGAALKDVDPIEPEKKIQEQSSAKSVNDLPLNAESDSNRQSTRGAALKDADSIEPEKKIQEQCPAKSVEDSPLNAESDSNQQSSRGAALKDVDPIEPERESPEEDLSTSVDDALDDLSLNAEPKLNNQNGHDQATDVLATEPIVAASYTPSPLLELLQYGIGKKEILTPKQKEKLGKISRAFDLLSQHVIRKIPDKEFQEEGLFRVNVSKEEKESLKRYLIKQSSDKKLIKKIERIPLSMNLAILKDFIKEMNLFSNDLQLDVFVFGENPPQEPVQIIKKLKELIEKLSVDPINQKQHLKTFLTIAYRVSGLSAQNKMSAKNIALAINDILSPIQDDLSNQAAMLDNLAAYQQKASWINEFTMSMINYYPQIFLGIAQD